MLAAEQHPPGPQDRGGLSDAARQLEWAAIAGVAAAQTARGLHEEDRAERVAQLAVGVATRLGCTAEEREDLKELVALHDIGMIGIPDEILRKPTPLTAAERARLCGHPLIGSAMLSALPSLKRLAPMLELEHEQWDGAGYPHGLAGEQIPLSARILLACHAYVAMRHARPDRPALDHELAVAVLRRNAGTQFCPTTAAALIAELEPGAQIEPLVETVVVAPRVRRTEPPRLSLRAYLATSAVGVAVGAIAFLPPPDVGARCPPAGEGRVYCVLQLSWAAALTKILLVVVALLILVTLVLVTYPRWRRGELRGRDSPWPDPHDRLLAAASWTLTGDDAEDADETGGAASGPARDARSLL